MPILIGSNVIEMLSGVVLEHNRAYVRIISEVYSQDQLVSGIRILIGRDWIVEPLDDDFSKGSSVKVVPPKNESAKLGKLATMSGRLTQNLPMVLSKEASKTGS